MVQRSLLYRSIREYFDKAGFLEVETPLLTHAPIPEAHIELFSSQAITPDGSRKNLYLVPSPEVWMKHLLAQGMPSMYQISRCFRNGEQHDKWHRREFSMLEWYELSSSADSNIARMAELFALLQKKIAPNSPPEEFHILTMEQAFRNYAGFSLEDDLLNAGWNRPSASFTSEAESTKAILSHRLIERALFPGSINERPDDLFHRLFITLVEPHLPFQQPLILKDWPALIPTLARHIPGTPWADRWEMYYQGVEIANCYTEENRLEALTEYWQDQEKIKAGAAVPAASDENWPALIAGNMPPCSGAAVGLDRLLALLRGDKSLRGVDIAPP
ncbi:MAG: hypothetical protein B0D92_03375 [Spirochaeta sp. LUC14_002_19_P3]|nr:MAG: hypothetical protein B0D92_03375 [Spirochaeta sp. LUC14_002_19_P3]